MKYKAGDKVRIRKDIKLDEDYNGIIVTMSMLRHAGEVCTIQGTGCDGCYYFKENIYAWAEDMIEGYEIVQMDSSELWEGKQMPKFKPKTKIVFTEDYRVAFGCVRKNTKGEVLGIGKIGDDDFYYSIAIGDERKKAHIPVENMDKVCVEDKTQNKHDILNGLFNSDGSIDGEKLMKKLESQNDSVNHPSHYTDGNIEVIDFIEDKKLGYHLGNACKYICRAGKKDPAKRVEDLRKAIWYVNRQAEIWEREQE